MSFRCRYLGRRFPCCRRCACAVVLVVYIVTAAGIPLPSGARPHKSGELFPCAHCGCGCNSAEFCWRSCCCHTLAERFAWARKHAVRPPEFALAEARQAGLDVSFCESDHGKLATSAEKVCCVKQPAVAAGPSCCQQHVSAAPTRQPACCSKHHDRPSATPDRDQDNKNYVIGWRALACHGHSLDWLAAVPTLTSTHLELSEQLPPLAWIRPAASDTAAGISPLPAVPPPEWA